jgi:hypothetical protein
MKIRSPFFFVAHFVPLFLFLPIKNPRFLQGRFGSGTYFFLSETISNLRAKKKFPDQSQGVKSIGRVSRKC